MTIGSSIKVKDISLEGLTLLDVPSAVVLSVKTIRGVQEKTEEEENAAPAAAEE
jgi:hypothetical protein